MTKSFFAFKRFVFLREYKVGNAEHSDKAKETVWVYSCGLLFNQKRITRITITNHFQIGHSDVITRKLVCGLVRRLHKKRMEPEPKEKSTDRDVFVRERMTYSRKKYRLIFWFKNGSTNHLWIRNCHPQD